MEWRARAGTDSHTVRASTLHESQRFSASPHDEQHLALYAFSSPINASSLGLMAHSPALPHATGASARASSYYQRMTTR
jgi:hypothetical protein